MDIASACLAGVKCRYDGGKNEDETVRCMYERGDLKLVCPECLGNLSVPRCPSEIVSGEGGDVLEGCARVMTRDGNDVTAEFLEGAQKSLEAAKACGAKRAYLKAKSPSCGCGQIYDGTFSGKLREGDGVTAALLKKHGIEVIEV